MHEYKCKSRVISEFLSPLPDGLSPLYSAAVGKPLIGLKLVTAVMKNCEVALNPRVRNGLAAGVFFQIGLSYVGAEAAAVVNEHMIPRLVSGRLGFVGIIPCVACQTARIDRHDDAPVVVEFMGNDDAEIVVDSRRIPSICV